MLSLTTGIDMNNNSEQNSHSYDENLFIIRQCGWMTSVVVALLVHFLYRRSKFPTTHSSSSRDCSYSYVYDGGRFDYFFSSFQWCQLAAYVTAMDAIWTDLLQMDPYPFFTSGFSFNDDTNTSRVVFFCGNFGIILLHSSWCDDHGGRSALDILQKMIEVTMMRGAQSGGIVIFRFCFYFHVLLV